jgi:hypothetical protein
LGGDGGLRRMIAHRGADQEVGIGRDPHRTPAHPSAIALSKSSSDCGCVPG